MRIVAACFLFVSVVAEMGFGQTGVAITGKVTDPNGIGLPNAVVRLAIADLETETDASGNYALGTAKVVVRQLLAAKSGVFWQSRSWRLVSALFY